MEAPQEKSFLQKYWIYMALGLAALGACFSFFLLLACLVDELTDFWRCSVGPWICGGGRTGRWRWRWWRRRGAAKVECDGAVSVVRICGCRCALPPYEYMNGQYAT